MRDPGLEHLGAQPFDPAGDDGLARDTGAAVVLLCHTRKDGRAAGGYTLISSVRQALEIERSAYGPERKLKVLKSNVMPDSGTEGLAFTITGGAPRTRIEWAWNVRNIASGQSSTEQVLSVLRKAAARGESPVTAQAATARTGLSYPHVRMILSRRRRLPCHPCTGWRASAPRC